METIIWLAIIGVIIWYYHSRKKSGGEPLDVPATIKRAEACAYYWKKDIFQLVHFDSPHFIDRQNDFDAMEINYLRLKQRFSNEPNKVLELARDWCKYAEALHSLKFARVYFDVDMSEQAFERLEETSKEPWIIKEEVEKKFKSLLGADFQEIPPDYFKRMETMGEVPKEIKDRLGMVRDWQYYYRDDKNLWEMNKKRAKWEEEWKAKQEKEKQEKEKAEASAKKGESIGNKFWKWLMQDSEDKKQGKTTQSEKK